MRTRPPVDYRTTVTDYFDLMLPAPSGQRRLTFGEPEASDCALRGTGGRHLGWMVPVIQDIVPAPAAAAPVARSANGRRVATARSGTAAAPAALAATAEVVPVVASGDGAPSATLKEVEISGKGYFFWFSHETLAAVTRRPDACPP
ncbi:MAG TPA: hypothetical protein VFX50_11460 [Gemmatimonadales bacterium]|nr:hypothetical protein [Gemmatimonadales bacterium]